MLKALIFLLVSFGSICDAKCSFNTSKYLYELSNPSSINSIDIDISKSKKWASNSLKIIIDKSPIINRKYKKKFKAKIIVHYDFGICSFKGKVRQTGDNKDHIEYNGFKAKQSLNVDLDTGNILSATSFKLLLPNTRGGDNEIFGTLLLRQLGYIAPKTFSVRSRINSDIISYTFQENPKKELLERNGRREGPIFEGDESLVGENFLTAKSDKFWKVRKHIVGARLANANWPKKSAKYFLVTLQSFILLQKEMLRYEISYPQKKLHMNPNRENNNKSFSRFNFLMLAMGGEHGLYSNNRKFYFNSLKGFFEPIYYDGDLDFQSSILQHFAVYGPTDLDHFFSDIGKVEMDKLKNQIINIDETIFSAAFSKHSRKDSDRSLEISIKFINQILSNLDELINRYEERNYVASSKVDYSQILRGIKRKSIENGVDQNMFKVSYINASNVGLLSHCIGIINDWCEKSIMGLDDAVKIMNKNELNLSRTLFVDINKSFDQSNLFSTTKTPFGDIVHSLGSEVILSLENKKTIDLKQIKANDWFKFKDVELPDLEINLIGISSKSDTFSSEQTDVFNLTGCLNFYNVVFKGTKINSSGGACEDSVNVVGGEGLIDIINVQHAFSDAVDFDFSNLIVKKMSLFRAGNDCLDVSAGHYQIIDLLAKECGDKGLSVGEASVFSGDNILIFKSLVGVASKDSSITEVKNLTIIDTNSCLEAFNKKPEFNGGVIQIDKYFCKGPISIDDNSSLNLEQ